MLAGAGLLSVAAAAGKPDPARFLAVDRARQTVHLTLIAADGASNNGFNFDGYGRGELLVRVPLGWRMIVRCVNGGTLRESCAVVSGPNAIRLAFRGASTPDPLQGMARGGRATFSFRATRTGVYRLTSLVPGHEQARMYAVLVVARAGRPTISARPGP